MNSFHCHLLLLLRAGAGAARGADGVEFSEQTPEAVKDVERRGNGVVLPVFRYAFSRGTNVGFEHFDVLFPPPVGGLSTELSRFWHPRL